MCVFVMRQLVPPTELLWLEQSTLMPHIDMLGQWAQGPVRQGQRRAVACTFSPDPEFKEVNLHVWPGWYRRKI